jgi:hypothetical protein
LHICIYIYLVYKNNKVEKLISINNTKNKIKSLNKGDNPWHF